MGRSRVLQPGRIGALLGPTNTGKTHRAIERMLAHGSGMIGLPLRLLAREVYDRVVETRGAGAVALITGEEKIIPAKPQYFVCTVESMPVDRVVAFVAVDEVQLAGNRNRGHTFTDRLLHARGVRETLFLGSDTMAPLLQELVPDVVIDTAPRLSRLTYAGSRKLLTVPKRSAVVAFSAERLYAIAERLRSAHGGVAVVLGALSPRTRNAQVAMYQAGEVQHLVATDAIGMGLNMDLHHVTFSATRKYDGHQVRDLTASEVAQIAGRAGRYTTDGTFGTTREVGELSPGVVHAVEAHAFPPVARLYWRNSALDFSSPAALLETLRQAPPSPRLRPCHSEVDQRALEDLLERADVAALATDPDRVRRLWAVCQVPDYRKTLTGSHTELLAQLATFLLDGDACLPDDWVAQRLERLDRAEGDLDTLMARIAYVRTWTYVAHQKDWTTDATHWQRRTRAIDDRLSDALHERLTQRFVDRRVMLVVGGQAAHAELELAEDGTVRLGGIEVGLVRHGSFTPGEGASARTIDSAVRRRLRSEVLARLERLRSCDDDAVVIDERGHLVWEGWALGRLDRGPGVLEPKLSLHRLDLLDAGEREAVRQRLASWLARWIESLFAPLRRTARSDLTPAARGVVYQLEQGLGSVDRVQIDEAVGLLDAEDRAALARLDVRIGTRTVYVQSLLREAALGRRAILQSVAQGEPTLLSPPGSGRTSVPLDDAEPAFLMAVGFRPVGDRAVRVDVLEKVLAYLRKVARSGDPDTLQPVMSWLGADRAGVGRLARALGYEVRADGDQVQIRKARPRRRRRRGRAR